MQRTALYIVEKAFEATRIKSEHDSGFPAERAEYGLQLLQSMMDMWRLDSSMAQTWDATAFCALVGGQESYTVGATGSDLVTGDERPEGILRAWIQAANMTYPMVQVTGQDYYRSPRMTAVMSTRPATFFYSQEYPQGIITVFPKPSASYEMHIQYAAPIITPSALTDNVTYGPGYIQALIYSLAQLIAVTYNIDNPKIDAAAAQYKDMIRMSRKRQTPNAILDPMVSARGSSGHSNTTTQGPLYDINSNSFVGYL